MPNVMSFCLKKTKLFLGINKQVKEIKIFMKILFIFLSLFLISIKADEIYYDDSNEFFTSKQGEKFLKEYFNKPLDTLQEAIGDFEVLNIQRIENVKEICNIFELHYDKQQNVCFDDFGKKFCSLKNKNEMEKYILEFVEIPVNLNNSGYMFMEDNICGYVGKIKIFGYIWDFENRGGGIELTRKLNKEEKIFSISENPLQAYRQGLIQKEENKAKKYLICKSKFCSPKALLIEHD